MKTIKQYRSLLLYTLALAMVVVLGATGCNGGAAGSASTKVTDDTSVMAMSFKAPEGAESIERFSQFDADGKVIAKDITYYFEDDQEVVFSFMANENIEDDLSEQETESVEIAGKTFTAIDLLGYRLAGVSVGEDSYALACMQDDDAETSMFDSAAEGISFTDATTTATDDLVIEGVTYTVDDSLNKTSSSVRVTVDPEGNTTIKSLVLNFGESIDDEDISLLVKVFKNSTLDDILDEDREYKDVTYNGITYKALYEEDADEPYKCYYQSGDDVYLLCNNGTSNGLFTTRTDKSKTAFVNLMNTVSFE